MKKIFLFIILTSLFNCSSNDSLEEIPEATIVGRWNLKNFEGKVLYEFTENKRFTLYSSNGVFESVQDLIASGRTGNDWWLEGNTITVDLNLGNFSSLIPVFKCNNNVIEWLDSSNTIHSVYFRENYVLSVCSE